MPWPVPRTGPVGGAPYGRRMTVTLDARALNRTYLARQHLDRPTGGPVEDVVRRLVAVQAQEPNWAIVGIWLRSGADQEAVRRAVEARVLVRSPLLRGTQHLTAADDYLWLRPTLQPVMDRLVRAPYYREGTAGVDHAELVAAAVDVLGERTLTRRELGAALAERFGAGKPAVLASAFEALHPVAHDPATSAWGSWWSRRSIAVTRAAVWLGREPRDADVRRLVRRYLAAHGPADVMDLQAWVGLTRLRDVVGGMRDELREVRGPDGRVLLDVPDAPLVGGDAPAPVRFLPAFDGAVLAHRDRTRILPEAVRREVMPGWSDVRPTVLVDGYVAALWDRADDVLTVRALRPLTAAERDDVMAEAERVAAFVGADGAVRLT